jgi:hypothetical protein
MPACSNASRIGEAASLISETSLISYVSLLGFNSTLVRFLPTADDRNVQINAGLTLCAGAAVIVATGYVLGLPMLAPGKQAARPGRARDRSSQILAYSSYRLPAAAPHIRHVLSGGCRIWS